MGQKMGGRLKNGGDICISMTDSCWGLTENSKILWSNYPSIKNKLIKKKSKQMIWIGAGFDWRQIVGKENEILSNSIPISSSVPQVFRGLPRDQAADCAEPCMYSSTWGHRRGPVWGEGALGRLSPLSGLDLLWDFIHPSSACHFPLIYKGSSPSTERR